MDNTNDHCANDENLRRDLEYFIPYRYKRKAFSAQAGAVGDECSMFLIAFYESCKVY